MRAAPLVLALPLALASCPAHRPAPTRAPAAPAAEAPPPPDPPTSWRDSYDLDGDGIRDVIVDEFTGGAHCCYHIGATLSTTATTVMLPFDLDGGYVYGLDLSQPERFAIREPEGALPELIVEIETYNGEPQPMDPTWKRRFGIKTRRVAICFREGRVRVRDYVPELPPCK